MKVSINKKENKDVLTLIPDDNYELSLLKKFSENKKQLTYEIVNVERPSELKTNKQIIIFNENLVISFENKNE